MNFLFNVTADINIVSLLREYDEKIQQVYALYSNSPYRMLDQLDVLLTNVKENNNEVHLPNFELLCLYCLRHEESIEGMKHILQKHESLVHDIIVQMFLHLGNTQTMDTLLSLEMVLETTVKSLLFSINSAETIKIQLDQINMHMVSWIKDMLSSDSMEVSMHMLNKACALFYIHYVNVDTGLIDAFRSNRISEIMNEFLMVNLSQHNSQLTQFLKQDMKYNRLDFDHDTFYESTIYNFTLFLNTVVPPSDDPYSHWLLLMLLGQLCQTSYNISSNAAISILHLHGNLSGEKIVNYINNTLELEASQMEQLSKASLDMQTAVLERVSNGILEIPVTDITCTLLSQFLATFGTVTSALLEKQDNASHFESIGGYSHLEVLYSRILLFLYTFDGDSIKPIRDQLDHLYSLFIQMTAYSHTMKFIISSTIVQNIATLVRFDIRVVSQATHCSNEMKSVRIAICKFISQSRSKSSRSFRGDTDSFIDVSILNSLFPAQPQNYQLYPFSWMKQINLCNIGSGARQLAYLRSMLSTIQVLHIKLEHQVLTWKQLLSNYSEQITQAFRNGEIVSYRLLKTVATQLYKKHELSSTNNKRSTNAWHTLESSVSQFKDNSSQLNNAVKIESTYAALQNWRNKIQDAGIYNIPSFIRQHSSHIEQTQARNTIMTKQITRNFSNSEAIAGTIQRLYDYTRPLGTMSSDDIHKMRLLLEERSSVLSPPVLTEHENKRQGVSLLHVLNCWSENDIVTLHKMIQGPSIVSPDTLSRLTKAHSNFQQKYCEWILSSRISPDMTEIKTVLDALNTLFSHTGQQRASVSIEWRIRQQMVDSKFVGSFLISCFAYTMEQFKLHHKIQLELSTILEFNEKHPMTSTSIRTVNIPNGRLKRELAQHCNYDIASNFVQYHNEVGELSQLLISVTTGRAMARSPRVVPNAELAAYLLQNPTKSFLNTKEGIALFELYHTSVKEQVASNLNELKDSPVCNNDQSPSSIHRNLASIIDCEKRALFGEKPQIDEKMLTNIDSYFSDLTFDSNQFIPKPILHHIAVMKAANHGYLQACVKTASSETFMDSNTSPHETQPDGMSRYEWRNNLRVLMTHILLLEPSQNEIYRKLEVESSTDKLLRFLAYEYERIKLLRYLEGSSVHLLPDVAFLIEKLKLIPDFSVMHPGKKHRLFMQTYYQAHYNYSLWQSVEKIEQYEAMVWLCAKKLLHQARKDAKTRTSKMHRFQQQIQKALLEAQIRRAESELNMLSVQYIQPCLNLLDVLSHCQDENLRSYIRSMIIHHRSIFSRKQLFSLLLS